MYIIIICTYLPWQVGYNLNVIKICYSSNIYVSFLYLLQFITVGEFVTTDVC